MKALTYSIVNVIGLIIMLVVNFMEIFAPMNNNTIAGISAGYNNILVPISMTFSVAWTVIYLLLIAAVGYQLYQSMTKNGYNYPKKVGWWLVINFILNAAWVIAFTNNMMAVSLVIIIALLITLIIIYRKNEPKTPDVVTKTAISVYLGWIIVATFLNLYGFLISIGSADYNSIFGIDTTIIGIIMLAVVTFIGYRMTMGNNDIFFSVILIWAFVGMAMKNYNGNMIYALASIVFAVILGIIVISKLMKKTTKSKRA